MKSVIADCMLLSAADDEIAAIGFTSSTAAASRYNELEISRSIGTNFLQRREGGNHARIAIPTQHPARIAHLYRAEDGSEPASRVILDWPECMAIRADSTKETKGFRLVAYDRALQRREYLFAVIDREANFSLEQALPAFVDTNFFPGSGAIDKTPSHRPLVNI